ncbi:MAG TPA: NADPH-dependent FMN reductase [Mycobacteriales bacterium]|nr:NADPH-dependent FMN reductase [Mycobacteriales bacterium]
MAADPAGVPPPFVVGIGGTGTFRSSTERALRVALHGAECSGARVRLFGGGFLGTLPLFRPGCAERCADVADMLDAVCAADGVIIASPSYHAGVSAMVKNALDYLEDLRDDPRPYLDGRAVGCIVTAAGWQACGTTLTALRSIVHALRGWPTPLGVTLNTSDGPFDPDRAGQHSRAAGALDVVGRQVVELASAFRAYRAVGQVAGAAR